MGGYDTYTEKEDGLAWQLLEDMPAGVMVFRDKGAKELVYANDRLLELLECADRAQLERLTKNGLFPLICPKDRELAEHVLRELPGEGAGALRFGIVTGRGRTRYVQGWSRQVRGQGKEKLWCLFLTEPAGLTGQGLDAVTGLPDMRLFFELAKERRAQYPSRLAVGHLATLFCDLLNFDLVNVNCGMDRGDTLLREVGELLREVFPGSVVSRFDSDHFVVLTDTEKLEERIGTACDRVKTMVPGVPLGLQAGIYVWEDPQVSVESAFRFSKTAFGRIRGRMEERFGYYREEMGQKLELRDYVITHIDEAVRQGWIQVYYQPIVRTVSRQLCAMEALARWIDPVHGFLSPADFIGPLEDSHLIHKLDCFVIDRVCANYAENQAKGEPTVAVSLNLSRLDFLCCDIFAEVEKAVRRYDVPRDMLHIEITESILSGNEGQISAVLDRFSKTGYEIWMDDFGSGYSTLNLLQDHRFDVLKIDMAFLKRDTERSRSIIASIIAMDKEIGNRTLAEGVETEEQFAFLKNSGCEKAQGYFFGRPLPYRESVRHCLEAGMTVESRKWKSYYDAVGQVNFLTDMPLALLEYEEGRFSPLFVNQSCHQVLEEAGETSERILRQLKVGDDVVGKGFRKAAEWSIATGQAGEYYYPVGSQFMKVVYRIVTHCSGRYLFAVSLSNVTRKDSKGEFVQENLLRNIYYVYDGIFVICPEKDDIWPITIEEGRREEKLSLSLQIRQTSDKRIYSMDRRRYEAFMDRESLLQRVRAAKGKILKDCFRTRNFDGSFTWKTHLVLAVPGTRQNLLLYCVRPMDGGMAGSPARAAGTADEKALAQEIRPYLWDSLMAMTPVPSFYKDKDRRFLGVSQSYLEYFGLESEDQVVGRRDEQMRWHVENDSFRADEERVLTTGECISSRLDRRLIRGQMRDTLITRYPVYREGRICGLMGYILDVEKLREQGELLQRDLLTDPVTGLANFRGIIENLAQYAEDYHVHGSAYVILLCDIPEIRRLVKTYGQEQGKAVLRECAKAITEAAENGAVGRLMENRFAVLYAYRTRDEVEKLRDRVVSAVQQIHQVEGRGCTLFAGIREIYADQGLSAPEELLELIRGEAVEEPSSDAGRREEMGGWEENVRDFFMDMPIGAYIVKPDRTIDLWNRAAEEITGYTKERMLGRRCPETGLNHVDEEGLPLCEAHCPFMLTLETGKPISKRVFVRHREGYRLLINTVFLPLRDRAGRIMAVAELFDRADEKRYNGDTLQKLSEMATIDPVSGLPGRRYLESFLRYKLAEYRRLGLPFAVLFADINQFRSFNNCYGHEMGDRILRAFGEALRQRQRSTDRWGRWGGDEFVAVFSLRDRSEISRLAQRFWQVAEQVQIKCGDQLLHIHVSIGITAVREGDDEQTILDRADSYMYRAKRGEGRGIVTDNTLRRENT